MWSQYMKKRRVYVMDCVDFIKIGVSQNPNNRKKQIPYKVMQYYSSKPIDNPFEIERKMHRYFVNDTAMDIGKEYFYSSFVKAVEKLMEMIDGRPKPEIDRLKVCLVGGDGYEETERRIIEKLKNAIPKMSDFDKGYILGKVENMAEQKEKKHKEVKEA